MKRCPDCGKQLDYYAQACRNCGAVLLVDGRAAPPSWGPMDSDRWGSPGKPQSVLVLGILNLVFGALGLMGIFFTMFILSNTEMYQQNNPVWDAMQESETYQAINDVSMVVGLFAVGALMMAGSGLLQMRPWARKLTIYYAIFAIAQNIFATFVNYIYIFGPMLEKSSGDAARSGAVGGMMGGCFGMIYPVVLLIFMTRPHVVAAFDRVEAEENDL